MATSVLAEMGRYLNETVTILEDGQRELADGLENGSLSRTSCPGPLQGDGQNVANIFHLVQDLMCEETEEHDELSHKRLQNMGKQGHMALLGHCLTAYISVLDKERFRKLTTRILSDTTLWLCRLFRYENSSAFFHDDEREGLVRLCRLVLNTLYEDYATEGYAALGSTQTLIYHSASSEPGLGQHLCSQLGLPLSSLCTVPCNSVFGSQHQTDLDVLENLIKEDIEAGRLPLMLIANTGISGVDHTHKLGGLKSLCEKYNMWLHVEGVSLATLALDQVPSGVKTAINCDSMTLTLGQWLGLPAVPAITLYRHEDPALSLTAGLTSSHPVEKLRPLPLWLALQYLGNDGIVHKIRHATDLSKHLMERLTTVASIQTSVENDFSPPEVLFRFTQESSPEHGSGSVEGCCTGDKDIMDTFNRWLGERLAQLVPISGVDVVELEDDGTCVRFNPLMTAAVLGTQQSDVELLVERLSELVPVLRSTLGLREGFRQEVQRHAPFLCQIEDVNWPGLGIIRYNSQWCGEMSADKQIQEEVKINIELMKKLQEVETDVSFSTGPEYGPASDRIFVGMVTENLDISQLVDTIAALGREIEENGKLFENMAEVVQRGIQEAELQLQEDSAKKIMEEGVWRQLPVVSSVLNWFSPVESSVKGRTFNLADGSLDSTEPTYSTKAQTSGLHQPDTPTTLAHRLPGRKLFLPSEDLDTAMDSAGESEGPTKEECHAALIPTATINPFPTISPTLLACGDAGKDPESNESALEQEENAPTSAEWQVDETG